MPDSGEWDFRDWPAERHRIPGDALELIRYALEKALDGLQQAQARIRELEQEVERLDNLSDDLCLAAAKLSKECEGWKANYDVTVKNMIAEYDEAQARIQELEQSRDNWRAKAWG